MTALPLKKPIQAHKETVSVLEFREPTGDEIIRCGIPFTVVTDPASPSKVEIKFASDSIGTYISSLCGIPMSSVKQMSAPDFMKALGVVTGFFGDGALSIFGGATSKPPGSGETPGTSSS